MFQILWGIDAIIMIIILYFFFVGMADGSVSSTNMGMWMGIIFGMAVVLLGSILLRTHDFPLLSRGLLAIPAVPGLFYLLFLIVVVLSKGKWN